MSASDHVVARSPLLLAAILAAGACATGAAWDPAYRLGEPMPWDCGPNGGRFAVLHRGGQVLDSVDLFFGVHRLPDGVAFAPVRTHPAPPEIEFRCPGVPVVARGSGRTPLHEEVPLFDPDFPAALVDGSALLYWGFRGSRVYAARFDFSSARLDTVFLADDPLLLATDNRAQFLPPERVDGELEFVTATGRAFRVDFGAAP